MAGIVTTPTCRGNSARRAARRLRPGCTAAALSSVALLLIALSQRANLTALALSSALAVLALGFALWDKRLEFWLAGILAVGGMAWAHSETEVLAIAVAGRSVSAQVHQERLEVSIPAIEPSYVGVALAPADETPLAARWAFGRWPIVADLADWLNTGLLSGIAVTVVEAGRTDEPAGALLAFQSPDGREPPRVEPIAGSWRVTLGASGQDEIWLDRPLAGSYQVLVSVARPGPAVRVFVLGSAPGAEAPSVLVAPAQRTFAIERASTDPSAETLQGGLFAYHRPPTAWLQALGRELSRTWLFAMLWLAIARMVAGPTGRFAPAFSFRPPFWPVAMVLGIGSLTISASVAWYVLQGIPHVQDSVTYLFQAQVFALGRTWVPAPPLPEFFEQEFVVVHDGRWFGKYPPGQPLMLTPGVLAGMPWLMSPLEAAATVILIFMIGRHLYGPGTGLLAAILLQTSPFFIFMSGSMMAHPAGLLWNTVAQFGTVAYWQRPSGRAALAVGFASGMLFITRPLTAAVLLPILAMLGIAWGRRIERRRTDPIFFLAGAAPPLLFLLYFNWSTIGDPLRNPYELWWSFDRVGFGPGIGMHGPHDLEKGLGNTWANTVELMRHLWGWPGYLTLAPALIPLARLTRKPWDWALALCLPSLAAAYVFYWADGIMYGPRYYFEAVGALALLSARGLAMLARFPSGVAGSRHGRWTAAHPLAAATTAAIVGALVAGNLAGYMPPMLRLHVGYNGVSREPLKAVEGAGLRHALVFVKQVWPDWQPYGAVFPANGPLLRADVVFARDLGPAENRRLMAWFPDREPWLMDGLMLRRIDR